MADDKTPGTAAETDQKQDPVPGDLKVVHESPVLPVSSAPSFSSSSSSPSFTPPPSPAPSEISEDARLPREELIEQATKFLEASTVKDAPVNEKREFLESKGLTGSEVDALLSKGKGKELVVLPQPQQQKPLTAPPSQPNPVPPILTYPEFLVPPPPPPPQILSAGTIVSSLYLASGVAATIYGANKFLFTPMYDALTAARLDLSAVTLKNLTELNTRLHELIPEGKALALPRSSSDEDADSDTSSISDPSEFFHVDAMTQTSPSLEALGVLDDDTVDPGTLTPDGKLEHLGTQLKALVESHSDGTDNELTFALEDLTSYLETLTYDSEFASSIYLNSYGGYGGGKKELDKDDPIVKVKTEIRSVKGVLLNSKNFPTSR